MPRRDYSNDCAHVCANCDKASLLVDEETVLCAKRGVVPAGATCRKYTYDPLKRKPAPIQPLPEISPADLTL